MHEPCRKGFDPCPWNIRELLIPKCDNTALRTGSLGTAGLNVTRENRKQTNTIQDGEETQLKVHSFRLPPFEGSARCFERAGLDEFHGPATVSGLNRFVQATCLSGQTQRRENTGYAAAGRGRFVKKSGTNV